jgi:hypothetical protein
MQSFTELNLPGGVHIYVYDDAEQMQQALTQSDQNWVAGHANPDLGVILVSLPPGLTSISSWRQVTHGLACCLVWSPGSQVHWSAGLVQRRVGFHGRAAQIPITRFCSRMPLKRTRC